MNYDQDRIILRHYTSQLSSRSKHSQRTVCNNKAVYFIVGNARKEERDTLSYKYANCLRQYWRTNKKLTRVVYQSPQSAIAT